MFTRSFTWHHTILLNTVSQHLHTSSFSAHCSLRIICTCLILLPRSLVLILSFWQLGYLDVSKESIQNANPRNSYLPEYISAITLGYAEESNFHPDCSWVCMLPISLVKILDSHKHYSNRLLTSGWWAYSRKPVRCYFTLSLAYH